MEVAEREWQQFCDRVQASVRGAMVDIQLVHPDGTAEAIVQNVPLHRIALDNQSDPCNLNLVIEAGRPGGRPVRHIVVEPIHIRLKNGSGAERYNYLHILAENGTTIMEFHPGLNPAAVKGLEL